jgi:deoxyxylulose-5-phosphate synthase
VPSEEAAKLLAASAVYIYDPYGTKEGFAESLASALMEGGFPGPVKMMAAPNVYVSHESIDEQEIALGISVDQVFSLISAPKD